VRPPFQHGVHCSIARKVSKSAPRRLRSVPLRSITRPCRPLRNSSRAGIGATVTRRLAASVRRCPSSPKAKPRTCHNLSESKVHCCCGQLMTTTSRTQVPKFMEARSSPERRRERSAYASGQPLRPLPAGALRQVQAAARQKRRSVLWCPVRLPHLLQRQEFQVRHSTARLAAACCQGDRRQRRCADAIPRSWLRSSDLLRRLGFSLGSGVAGLLHRSAHDGRRGAGLLDVFGGIVLLAPGHLRCIRSLGRLLL
jgi:hypothetical protein